VTIAFEYFQPYLQSILSSVDRDWGNRYIPTQAELPLRVQACEVSQNELKISRSDAQKPRETFDDALDGLRKYAPEHVLLVGKPGSGKSTALRRLLWEEAERCIRAVEEVQESIPPIPVLLELRSLGSSVLELLQETLLWSGIDLEEETLRTLLRGKRFLLLLDGINEVPVDAARQVVGKFRQLCVQAGVPLIFTTRELGSGLDLGVTRKLEMLPLNKTQIWEFVQKQLPEQGNVLLQQIQGRLQELAETPLLLKLLCDVFQHNQQQVPRSRGELFRIFARDYDQIKPWDVVMASPGFREFRDELLRELAAAMMQGEQPTELRLQVSRDEAEQVLEKVLTGRVETPGQKAKEWLWDLIEHHLLQVAADPKQIEFHHQLFQEYYAAEWLFLELGNLSDEWFKYHYLNYLKWTEPLSMMMAFMQTKQSAEQLISLALEVDRSLGARLAGFVKLELQEMTVGLVEQVDQSWLKAELLGITCSIYAVPYLEKILQNEDPVLRWHVVNALGSIHSKSVIQLLIQAVDDTDLFVRFTAERILDTICASTPINILVFLAYRNLPLDLQEEAVELLLNPLSKDLTNFLKRIAEDPSQELALRRRSAVELSKINQELALNLIHRMLQEEEVYSIPREVSNIVGVDLREIRSQKSVELLLNILNSYKNSFVQSCSVMTLVKIGSQEAITPLLEMLKESVDVEFRMDIAYALQTLPSPSEEVLETLLDILQELNVSNHAELIYEISILLRNEN
jgi:HEAT repeat protein